MTTSTDSLTLSQISKNDYDLAIEWGSYTIQEMNLIIVIVVALSVFFSIGPLADEIPPGFDPGSSKAKGLILTFEDWPPDGVDTDPLLRKLHSAGLKLTSKFPRFRVWVFEWDNWQEGSRAENLCIELLLDDRTSSLFVSCEPDYMLHPAQPVADSVNTKVKVTRSAEVKVSYV